MANQRTIEWSARKRVDRYYKNQSSTKKVLWDVLYVADDVLNGYSRPSRMFASMSSRRRRHYLERLQKERQALLRLKKSKMVIVRKTGNKLSILLTQSGKTAVLRDIIRHKRDRLAGKNRLLVLYDLPESLKKQRQQFVRLMKRSGFVMLSQSAWYTKFDVEHELAELVRISGLRKHIHLFVGTSG